MALPASFSNNTSPTGVQLDNNFAAVANMGIWNTTATGTNSIALTSTANQPAVSAYTDRQRFQFIGPNNSSSSVTVAVDSLAALPLYLITGVQAGSGDVASGTPYEIIYLAALNSGGGGFQIFSAVPSSAAVAQSGPSLRGVVMTNNSGTPNTKIDITAGYSLLTTTGGTPKFLSLVSVTIDLTTTGANGMDTGARPTSGWVYNYVINNGSVTAGLATATAPSAGLPTFPGGYTTFAYVGAMYCDGSQNLKRIILHGKRSQYKLVGATNTATYPSVATGTSAASTWASTSISALVPVTATRFVGIVMANGGTVYCGLSPNGVAATLPTSTDMGVIVTNANATNAESKSVEFELETAQTVFYESNNASNGATCLGWFDDYGAG